MSDAEFSAKALWPYVILALVVLAGALLVWVANFERFSVQDAMAVVQAIGVVAGAFFAAQNLREIRVAAERETEPLLHVVLNKLYHEGDPGYSIEVHNLGRGGVVDVHARCWTRRRDLDPAFQVELERHDIELSDARIRSGDFVKGELHHSWFSEVMLSDLLLEVTYDSVRQRKNTLTLHYRAGSKGLDLTPLPTPRLRPPTA